MVSFIRRFYLHLLPIYLQFGRRFYLRFVADFIYDLLPIYLRFVADFIYDLLPIYLHLYLNGFSLRVELINIYRILDVWYVCRFHFDFTFYLSIFREIESGDMLSPLTPCLPLIHR